MISTTTSKLSSYGPPQRRALSSSPAGASQGNAQEFDQEIEEIDFALRTGARVCADAIGRAARYFQSEELWAIGSLPNCADPLTDLEANSKRLLTDSKVSSREIAFITAGLKSMYDLRVTARCARQVVHLAWGLREEGVEEMAYPLVRPLSDAIVPLAVQTAAALERGDIQGERAAALMYRQVDCARAEAEQALRHLPEADPSDASSGARVGLNETQRRVARAAVLFLSIGAESLARVSARRVALAAS